MIRSMTGFASAKGARAPHDWAWELRAVNARGLDLRLRIPDWLSGLETALRAELGKRLTRGSVTLALRVNRTDAAGAMSLNREALEQALDALAETEAAAARKGLELAPSRAGDILALRGVLDNGGDEEDVTPLITLLRSEFEPLIAAFLAMRESEGAALSDILRAQLDTVAELTERAGIMAESRKEIMAENLKLNLSRVLEHSDGADPDRVAQELALIAVKADVTEELDRLRAHVAAARALLSAGGPVGRKLDFLMQEFNREANTLCSKSQNSGLTAVGLELKAAIDQMREQVQNVE